MSIKKEAARLQSLGYQILKVSGKATNELNWSKWSQVEREEPLAMFSSDKGFGLILGPASGLICVDIDIDSDEILQKVLEIAPTNFAKFGAKGMSLFYAYDSYIKSTCISGFLDILSIGKYTVMPPSIHPKVNRPYIIPERFSQLVEKEYLPPLSEKAYNQIIDLFSNLKESDQAIALQENNGRYNKIKSMLIAAAVKQIEPEVTAKEVVEYDLANHEPPWFLDKGPGDGKCRNKSEAVKKALGMAKGCIKFAKRNHLLDENELLQIDFSKSQKTEIKELPPLTGELEKIFQLLKLRTNQADENILKIASMIILSNVCARHYLMSDGSPYMTTLNNFFLFLIPTGYGKTILFKAITDFSKEIFKNNKLSFKLIPKPGSTQSLYSQLEENSHNLCMYDEVTTVLDDMKKESTKSIAELMTSCWDCANDELIHPAFSLKAEEVRKEKTVKKNVSVTIVAATTPEGFEQSAQRSLITSGFLNRYMIITGRKLDSKIVEIDLEKVKESISEYIKSLYKIINDEIYFMVKNNNEELKKTILKELDSDKKNDNKMFARRTSHIQKLILLFAISDNPKSPEINESHYLRAKEVFNTLYENATTLIEGISQDNDFERDRDKTVSILKIKGPNLGESELRKIVSPKSRNYDAVLKSLIESNIIIKTIGKRSGHKFSYNWRAEFSE